MKIFTAQCETNVDTATPSYKLLFQADNVTEKEAIEAYFYSKFCCKVNLLFLDKYHDMRVSMSTL